MRKRTKAREAGLKTLYQLDITSEDIETILEDYWEDNQALPEVKEFASKMARGVAGQISNLDKIITRYADNWTIKRMAVIDRNVLRMAVYELMFMDDIPPKVSINEAIDLAKKYSDMDSGKFVNGILDRIKKVEFNDKK